MNVCIMDMGTRLNRFGGEAKIAGILFHKLKGFNTHYLGYGTAYVKKGKNAILLDRNKKLGVSLRKSFLSEINIFRAFYYFFFVQRLFGVNKDNIIKEIKKIKPKVIIANSIQDYPLIRFLKGSGIEFKTVYIDHGSISTNNTSGYFSKEGIPLTLGTGMNKLTLNDAKKEFFNSFDLNVALNKNQFYEIKKITKKVVYIPNGIEKKYEATEREKEILRKRYRIGKSDFVVMYVGRMFDRQKNVKTLISAFLKINEKNVKLMLVGDGTSINNYINMAKGDKRIVFTGYLDEKTIDRLYSIADLFVLPSVWEGFNLTVIEAACHNLPILLSEGASIRDYDLPGVNIPSFPTFNSDALREDIIKIMKNRVMRDDLVRNSKILKAYFTEKKMLEKYTKELKKLYPGR